MIKKKEFQEVDYIANIRVKTIAFREFVKITLDTTKSYRYTAKYDNVM